MPFDHYGYHIRALDAQNRGMLRGLKLNGPFWRSGPNGCPNAAFPASVVKGLMEGYCTPDSAFYRDPVCLTASAECIEAALDLQHEDGTIDLPETNFHDAAQMSFTLQRLVPVYELMLARLGTGAEERRLAERVGLFIDRGADGIMNGGFHTPNHRWVESSALALASHATGRTELMSKVNAFLNEGIDCDEDGEFTEKSNGVYNIICDRSLIYLARLLEDRREELYGFVTRNLRAVMSFIEPDGTINTMSSTRQDWFTSPKWTIYYSIFLYMAVETGDPEFAWMAEHMQDRNMDRHVYYDYHPEYELDPEMRKKMACLETKEPERHVNRYFSKSGMARYRDGRFSLSLVRDQPCFAKLQQRDHTVFLRFAGCFYAQGQFAAQEMERTDKGWRMTYRKRWGYKSPLPEKQDTSDWRMMDHSKRQDVMMQDFILTADAEPLERGLRLHLHSEGIDRVPLKFEIMLQPGGMYINEAAEMNGRGGDYVYQKTDQATYRYGDMCMLHIRGAFHTHVYGEAMRGSIYADGDHFFVCFTAFTPIDRTVELVFEDVEE